MADLALRGDEADVFAAHHVRRRNVGTHRKDVPTVLLFQ